MPPRGTKQELPDIQGATPDVASDEVGIHGFERRGRQNAARQHGVAEARREPLDLMLKVFEYVDLRSAGDVTVSPRRVISLGRTRGVEYAWLCQQHEWPLRVLPVADGSLGSCYFRCAAAQVDGGRPGAFTGLPGDRTCKGVIHFEGARSVAELLELALIACRQTVIRHSQQLLWCHIAHRHIGLGKIAQVVYAARCPDLRSQIRKMTAERVRDGLRSAARYRPSHSVRGGPE